MSLLQQINVMRLSSKRFWLMVIFMQAASHVPLFAEQLPVEKDPVGLVYIDNSGAQITAPLLSSTVDIDVTGLISRVTVKQVFVNSSADWINATYLFPLPENAAVDHLRMIIGERVIIGEIKEKEFAQREYQKAQVAGKKASLVTQKRNDIFTTSVANIAPNEIITIEVEYQHSISYQSGVFSLYFPMTITPRYALAMAVLTTEQRQQYLHNLANESDTGQTANGWEQRWDNLLAQKDSLQLAEHTTNHIRNNDDASLLMKIMVNVHSPLAITSINSLSHAIKTKNNSANEAIVTLTDTEVIANQDFVLTWQVQQTEQAESHLFIENKSASNEQYGLLMLMPPADNFTESARISKEVIFVIDVSGSMSGTSIEQAKLALRYGLDQLADGDTFNIISFSDNSTFFASNALPVDARSRVMANIFIDQLQASGGTNMSAALSAALLGQRTVFANQQVGLRQVIFITDASISNEEQILTMIKQNLGDSRLFMVAIGPAANHSFMKNSANLGKGSYTSIRDITEVNKSISALFAQLAAPVLTNLSMQWSDGSAVDYWPAPLSDLYQGEPLQFVFKIPVGKTALRIRAIGIDQGTTKDWMQDIDLPAQKYQNASGLDILWAKEKIDSIALNRQLTEQQKSEQISALGMQFHLVTKYTSLLAIEQKISRPTLFNAIDKQVKTEMPKGNTMRLPQTGLASGYYLQLALLLFSLVTLCWFVDHYFVTAKKERGACL